MSKVINTDAVPKAIGPYSQAVITGNLLYTSGQIPIDPQSGELTGSEIKAQTKRVCENLEAVLKEAGLDFCSVIKTTCFLQNMEDFSEFNEIYASYFINKPARSCVAVKALPKGALVEIELIAEMK